jgi:hypothetical protein
MKALALWLSLCAVAAITSPAMACSEDKLSDSDDSVVTASDDNNNLGVRVDTRGFFLANVGRLKILRAGGVAPHDSNSLGTVEREPDPEKSILTFGYCFPNGGGCDPGFIFLEDAKTQVYKQDVLGGTLYTILATDAGKQSKYTWLAEPNQVTFKNFQYQLPSGQITTLEHVMQKLFTLDDE